MSSAIDNLWPVDIAAVTEEMPPITILKQQSSLLGQMTRNIVEAEVETTSTDIEGFLRHTLYLVAPALNFYRYPLIDVEHEVTSMYPANVKMSRSDTKQKKILARDEKEFKDILKRVFADEETKKVIGALLAQSGGKKSIRIGNPKDSPARIGRPNKIG
jgi:hypothetical protein